MRVSRGSWHYRLWMWGREPYTLARPKNLCLYFWHLVFKIAVGTVALGLVLTGIGTFVWLLVNETADVLLALAVLAAWFSATFAFILLVRRVAKKKSNVGDPAKEPGPFRQYMRARKEKVCPMIELDD